MANQQDDFDDLAVDAHTQRERDIEKYADSVFYSARYSDDIFEYRHVILPKQLAQYLPKGELASEDLWRDLGVRQSPGWVHYAVHKPEPHIMLFRRPKELGIKYPSQHEA